MQIVRKLGVGVMAVVVVAWTMACVTPAEHRKLQRRVHMLENSGGGPGQGRARVADLGARLDALDSEIERISGRLEETEHRTREALEEARSARREAAQPGSAAASPASAGTGAAAAQPNSDELDAYRAARTAWSDDDPDACIDRFLNFLQTYPSSSHAENASYWMADCYFKRGDFKTAILRFDDVVARYPDGKRAPDALYRQGESLLRLGPRYGKAAGKAFDRVVQEYPNSARATEAQEQLELLRAG